MLRRQALALGSVFLFFFEVKVQIVFVELNLEAIDVVNLLNRLLIVGALVERDFVLARRDAEGKVFALVVGLEIVFLAVVLVHEFDHGSDKGFAFSILGDALDRSRCLGEDGRYTQSRHQDHEYEDCEIFSH
ncbi:MAG: hypothetical protein DMG77_13310 [Acidobacteria bacterium]|nr:MAG: hypothetical protein DMG77_13310 [Acidobacteriota bacterium]